MSTPPYPLTATWEYDKPARVIVGHASNAGLILYIAPPVVPDPVQPASLFHVYVYHGQATAETLVKTYYVGPRGVIPVQLVPGVKYIVHTTTVRLPGHYEVPGVYFENIVRISA